MCLQHDNLSGYGQSFRNEAASVKEADRSFAASKFVEKHKIILRMIKPYGGLTALRTPANVQGSLFFVVFVVFVV